MCAKSRLSNVILLLLILLAACARLKVAPSPTPTEIIRVQLTPSLLQWQDALHSCAVQLVGANLSLEILPADNLSLDTADLLIRLGPRQTDETQISILALDQVVIIAHPDIPLKELSTNDLVLIFTGKVGAWNELGESPNSAETLAIHPVQFDNNHGLSQILAAALALEEGITVHGKPVASISDMLYEVSITPGAIGYILASQLSDDVLVLSLSDQTAMADSLDHPVIAITKTQPQGSLLQLLLCLQGSN